MAASATDVRRWAQEEGYEVQSVGRLPTEITDAYERAHGAAAGVTEADFPPAPPGGDDDDGAAAPRGGAGGRRGRERRGRPRRGGARARGMSWRQAFKSFGSGGGRRGARSSLADWAEETWTDLAWLAQPLPPLSRVLQVQAPYAGVVFDDAVRGTPVDALLQPLARYSGSLRALNGLIGPPVMVAAICTQGTFMPDATGKALARDADGRPIPDQRTAVMLQLLRYSLLQMAKVSELNAEQVRQRTDDMAVRMAGVDLLIDSLFEWLPRRPAGAAPAPDGAAPGRQPVPAQVYLYPPDGATAMDDTGADPARAG
jgi:hypothetical protein